jgi:hypothetical protein
MANETLTFLSWVRERIAGLATAQSGGRVAGSAAVTLTGKTADGATTDTQTRTLRFLLAGPADVVGLQRRAIVRRFPAPDATDHESDRCPYVELADPSLPWRYTPVPKPAAGTGNLHPWLVLVVGVENTELTLDGDHVTIETAAQTGPQAIGAPAGAYRFAHVQVDGQGRRTSRILSGRRLQPGTEYLAVLVPAFDEAGRRRWTGAEVVTVPVYDAWRFRTAEPAGSFEDLAARLQPGPAPANLGQAVLRYPRLADAPELAVRGALIATTGGEPKPEQRLPDVIAEDIAGLRLPARDGQGRPIVTMPRYGDAWDTRAPERARWARGLNGDPRHRGVAGLGLEIGIRFQEELVADVLAHLGALAEARQRVRNLVLGVEASRSLWRRRVPADRMQRLWMLGPALPRVVTGRGTIAELATADDRTLPRGVFSAAARRTLRTGPARTALGAGPIRPAALLAATNRPPAALPATVDGVSLESIGAREFDLARRRVIDEGQVNQRALAAAAADIAGTVDARLRTVAGQLATALGRAAQLGQPAPWGIALPALAAADAAGVASGKDPVARVQMLSRTITSLRDRFDERADDDDLTELLGQLGASTANDPAVTGVALDRLANGVAAAFDPSGANAPAAERVLGTVDGLDPDQPLAPPELCVGLDRAAWADVEQAFREWLLPGVGLLPIDSVVALETNPVFTDAFLCGLNTQMLAELRWRNIPVVTGCTPLPRFWDRVDTSAGQRVDDIVGLHAWIAGSRLGDDSHHPPGGSGRDLVIAIRGALFQRYPTTVVYLRSAMHGTGVDLDRDPASGAPRILPGFQGRIGQDVAFFGFPGLNPAAVATHWLVFEEPPAGYRFANDNPAAETATTAHAWAAAAFAQPVRVLIRGDSLLPGGTP